MRLAPANVSTSAKVAEPLPERSTLSLPACSASHSRMEGSSGNRGLGRRREVVGENHVVGASSGEVANEHVLGHGRGAASKRL